MSVNPEEILDAANEHWKIRIVEEFDRMARTIISLRNLAAQGSDPVLSEKLGELHKCYCDMANTVSLRIMLNGIARELGCVEDDTVGIRDDAKPTNAA